MNDLTVDDDEIEDDDIESEEHEIQSYMELLEIRARDIGWYCRSIECQGGGSIENYYTSGDIVFGIGESGDTTEVTVEWSATLKPIKTTRENGHFSVVFAPEFEIEQSSMDNVPGHLFYRKELQQYADSFSESIDLKEYLLDSLPDVDF